jgi:hypothetical protein
MFLLAKKTGKILMKKFEIHIKSKNQSKLFILLKGNGTEDWANYFWLPIRFKYFYINSFFIKNKPVDSLNEKV